MISIIASWPQFANIYCYSIFKSNFLCQIFNLINLIRLLNKKSNTYSLILQKRKKKKRRNRSNSIFSNHSSSRFRYKFFKRYRFYKKNQILSIIDIITITGVPFDLNFKLDPSTSKGLS